MLEKITVCGSMQFAKEMQELTQQLEEWGWIVYLPEISEASSDYASLPTLERLSAKREFINNHFAKIKKSDAILVANYPKKGIDGYVGSNTLMEIAVAHALGKTVYVLHELANQGCREEVEALASAILGGSLNLLQPE